ncbi:hypothetical protein [Nostoc sp. FACHB-145]|nr:hypothetical protein [Nostoc sp. FACHB-145]
MCTPGMGVNLWGESPLWWNQRPKFCKADLRRYQAAIWSGAWIS